MWFDAVENDSRQMCENHWNVNGQNNSLLGSEWNSKPNEKSIQFRIVDISVFFAQSWNSLTENVYCFLPSVFSFLIRSLIVCTWFLFHFLTHVSLHSLFCFLYRQRLFYAMFDMCRHRIFVRKPFAENGCSGRCSLFIQRRRTEQNSHR